MLGSEEGRVAGPAAGHRAPTGSAKVQLRQRTRLRVTKYSPERHIPVLGGTICLQREGESPPGAKPLVLRGEFRPPVTEL